MAIGYSEQAAEVIAQELFPTDFSEDRTLDMVSNRLRVMHARLSDIEKAISMAMEIGEEVEIHIYQIAMVAF